MQILKRIMVSGYNLIHELKFTFFTEDNFEKIDMYKILHQNFELYFFSWTT